MEAKILIVKRFFDKVSSEKDFNKEEYDDLLRRSKKIAIEKTEMFNIDSFLLWYLFRYIFKVSKEQVLSYTCNIKAYNDLLTLINSRDRFVDSQINDAPLIIVSPEPPTLQ